MSKKNPARKPKTPKALYHYTKIENLALILQNRTIRFSSLNTVNDLTEGMTSDYGSLGHYIFVSCWTATQEEHIPMWNMYTQNMVGVRIKLPADPFQRYGKSIVPVEEVFYQKYSVEHHSFQLHRVIYTNDESLLKPKFAEIHSAKEATFNLEALGRYKPKVWKFESEWRYVFWILPKNIFNFGKESYTDKMFEEAIRNFGKKELPFDQYFLKIRDDAFEQMEIRLGPKHSDGDIAIAKALINTYNPKAQINLSTFAGKIRK